MSDDRGRIVTIKVPLAVPPGVIPEATENSAGREDAAGATVAAELVGATVVASNPVVFREIWIPARSIRRAVNHLAGVRLGVQYGGRH